MLTVPESEHVIREVLEAGASSSRPCALEGQKAGEFRKIFALAVEADSLLALVDDLAIHALEDAAHSITKLGADNVMFETDFPHPTCLYPNVKEQVQATLGGLERNVQRKVLYETAAKVYNLLSPV